MTSPTLSEVSEAGLLSSIATTITPLSIGVCGGIYTIPILNYSAWDEKNNSLQITSGNYWETEIVAKAPDGDVETTFGFTGTGATHAICLENNDSIELDVSTWITNNISNYVRRSYFILNTEYSNESETEYIRIHLLNISEASNVDFIVTDDFGRAKPNRIIKFFKFDPVNESYREMFNLLTDISGTAVGAIEAYDQWYRLVVINDEGEVTATIPSTQFSQATYSIVEVTGIFGQARGITWVPEWNNISKIFSLTLNSDISRTFKLTVDEVGIFSNTTYCTEQETGRSVIIYCDLSTLSVEEFNWELSYSGEDLLGNSVWYSLTQGTVYNGETATYGATGLILTIFLLFVIGMSFMYDPKVVIIMSMVALTIARTMTILVISEFALLSMWAVAIVLVYILRGEK